MGLGPDFVSALFNTMKIETSAISELKLCLRNLLSDLTNDVIVNGRFMFILVSTF